jgi:hypothetical protein
VLVGASSAVPPPPDVDDDELDNNSKVFSKVFDAEYGFFEQAGRALTAALQVIPNFTDVFEQVPRITTDAGMVPRE